MNLNLHKEAPSNYFPTSHLAQVRFEEKAITVLAQKWRSNSSKGANPDVWVMVPTYLAEKESNEQTA